MSNYHPVRTEMMRAIHDRRFKRAGLDPILCRPRSEENWSHDVLYRQSDTLMTFQAIHHFIFAWQTLIGSLLALFAAFLTVWVIRRLEPRNNR